MGSSPGVVLWLSVICIYCTVESSPVEQHKCLWDRFACGKGICIERKRVCDGTPDCSDGRDEIECKMQGIFQNVGNMKTARFPVYKAVKGFDIFMRFTASQCTGELVEITSRGTKDFLRITLLEVGPIRFSFNTLRGRGQLDFVMPNEGSFCDGKKHIFALNIFRGVVFYYVDRSPHVRFYASRLSVPFSTPDKIVLGRGLQGCISGATVINRFNKTEEYVIGTSAECVVKETTVRPSTVPTISRPEFTSIVMARKMAAPRDSLKPKCEPLTLEACKSLGYSSTQFPNILKHKTSHKASSELSALLSKLQPNCSPHLIPFLCQLYFPPCPLPQIPAPPCRSLCENVLEDCSLLSLKDHWPSHLSCEHFPRANDKAECFLASPKVTTRRTTLVRGSTVKNENVKEANSLEQSKVYLGKHDRSAKPLLATTARADRSNTEQQGNETNYRKEAQSYSTKLASFTKPLLPSTFPAKTSTDEQLTNNTRHSLKVAKEYSTKQVPVKKPVFPTTGSADTRVNEEPRNGKKYLKQGHDFPPKHGPSAKPVDPSAALPSPRTTKPTNETMNVDATKTSLYPSNLTTYSSSPSESGNCGGVLGSPKGQLASPGYPGGYPSNTTCRWVIALPNDYHAIRFTFQRVYLEEDRNCVYDYIAVYDMLDNQVGERYCGSITSPIHKDVKGNVAVVVFRSDSTNSKKGFSLTYNARKCRTSLEVDT